MIRSRSKESDNDEKKEDKLGMRLNNKYLSFIPIPALLLVIFALHLIVKPSLFYEPSWLLPIANTVFVMVVCFIVAYIAMRNYMATGRIQILLLGCGVLAFGIGGVIAGLVRSVPGAGANLNVTIYNTGALIGAIFHLAAAFILLAGISPKVGFERKRFWLVFGYVGLTGFMALLTMASLRSLIPPFFIQGVGPTALRQWVLGSADILFAFSFLIFMGSYLRNGERFLYWYSLALALTSISLTAFFIESAVGSPIGWTGRFSQYLGGIYFLISILTAIRSAQVRKTSFDDVLTASLSPAEEKFRALAEHSPDIIERFDRETKYIYVNQSGLRLYGKPTGSIIGKTLEEVGLPRSNVSLLKERIQRVFETAQPMEAEHSISAEDGTRFYQSHCVPEFGVDGTITNVLVISRDLTERKQAEEALSENEQRYRSLFNGMTEGFALHEIICDPNDVPCDYRFLEINPAFEQLTGLRREDVVGKTMNQILPNDDPKWVKIYGEVALTGKSAHFDNYSPSLQRHYEVFAYSPAPRLFGVLFIDITERKRAEEALRKNKERFEILSGAVSQLLSTDEPQKVVNELCRKVMAFLDCHVFFNYLVNQEKGRLHLNACAGISEEIAKEIEWLDYGVAVCGCAARDVSRIVCENIPTTPDPRTELVRSFGIKAYACHPLLSAGRVKGTLSFGTRSRTTFTEEELSLMNTVADRVAIAMEKIGLIEALRKSRDELEMRVQERTEELQAINDQLRVENEERLKVEIELRESEIRLRELSAALLSAQERERKLIAQEIHDSLGASLAATKFKVENALSEMGGDNPRTRVALESVIPIVQGTIEEARRIQMSLRPSILDDLGILPTIRWSCRQFESIYPAIRITKEIGIEEEEVPKSLKIVIYRVLQEALNNIAKHSKTSEVLLCLRKTDQAVLLVIQDRGQGFNPEEAYSRKGVAKGSGLDSMKERAELSGGSLDIESTEGKGTTISASWPLDRKG